MKTNLTKEQLLGSGIYQIYNLVNGKIYVGSAASLYARHKGHLSQLRKKRHHSVLLQRACNKHGEGNFVFELLELVGNKNNLIAREQYWIDLLKPEYNICPKAGNSLGRKCSPEQIYNMSLRMRGTKNCLGRKLSDETKAKISLAHKGKKTSKETGIKISLATKGGKRSVETRNKMSLAKRNMSQETKAKMSLANMGKKRWLGKTHSDETKAKMSLWQKGRKLSPEHCANIALAQKKRREKEKESQFG